MMIDKDLVFKLIFKHRNGDNNDWVAITEEYNSIKNENRSKNSLRSIWLRLSSEEKDSVVSGNDNKTNEYKETFRKNADGSYLYDRLIQMHESDLIDDTKVLNSFNLDPLKWVITSAEFNLWSVESKVKRLNNYQAKIKVKPKKLNDIDKHDLKDMFSNVYKLPKIDLIKPTSSNSFALRITDSHIGSSVFKEYSMYQMVEKAKIDIINGGFETVYIDFLGDILHVDNVNKTTDRGTQLEMPMSAYDMIRKAQEVITYTINELSLTDTEVRWTQGNHSRLTEWLFFRLIAESFSNNKHIKFMVDESRRKGYLIYNTFCGLFHGDMPKKNYYDVFHFEFSLLWGQANKWEIHSGHFHSLTQITKGGMLHTIHGIDKDTDTYEDSLGYMNMYNKVEAVIYNKELGRVETFLY